MQKTARRSLGERVTRTACAVAMATVMGGAALAAVGEAGAIEQIQRYCTTSWQRAGIARQEWSDCTQAALVRLLERVSRDGLVPAIADGESLQRQELNRAIWAVAQRVRRQQRLKVADLAQTPDSRQVRDTAWQELLAACGPQLPPRQRSILQLAGEGWSAAEIGRKLSLPPQRVSDEKYKALRKLRELESIG